MYIRENVYEVDRLGKRGVLVDWEGVDEEDGD